MTFSNISSNSIWPIVTNFHVELPWVEGRKKYANGLGYVTNMTTRNSIILENILIVSNTISLMTLRVSE